MIDRERNLKIAILVLAILLVLVIGYVAFEKLNTWKTTKYNQIYSSGYSQCLNDSVTQIFQRTNDCGVIPLILQNQTRSLADVSCIQKAIQQGLAQANASG